MMRIGKSTSVVLCCVVLCCGLFASCSDNEMDYDTGFSDDSWIGCSKSDEEDFGQVKDELYTYSKSYTLSSHATSVTFKGRLIDNSSDDTPIIVYTGNLCFRLFGSGGNEYTPKDYTTMTIDANGISTDGTVYIYVYSDTITDENMSTLDPEKVYSIGDDNYDSYSFTIRDLLDTYGGKFTVYTFSFTDGGSVDYTITYTTN